MISKKKTIDSFVNSLELNKVILLFDMILLVGLIFIFLLSAQITNNLGEKAKIIDPINSDFKELTPEIQQSVIEVMKIQTNFIALILLSVIFILGLYTGTRYAMYSTLMNVKKTWKKYFKYFFISLALVILYCIGIFFLQLILFFLFVGSIEFIYSQIAALMIFVGGISFFNYIIYLFNIEYFKTNSVIDAIKSFRNYIDWKMMFISVGLSGLILIFINLLFFILFIFLSKNTFLMLFTLSLSLFFLQQTTFYNLLGNDEKVKSEKTVKKTLTKTKVMKKTLTKKKVVKKLKKLSKQ